MPSNTADECSERIRSCVNSMRPTNSLLRSSPWQTSPAQASYACGRTWRYRRFSHSRHRAETNHRVTFATESYLYLIHYRTAQLFVNTGSYFSQTRKAPARLPFPKPALRKRFLQAILFAANLAKHPAPCRASRLSRPAHHAAVSGTESNKGPAAFQPRAPRKS